MITTLGNIPKTWLLYSWVLCIEKNILYIYIAPNIAMVMFRIFFRRHRPRWGLIGLIQKKIKKMGPPFFQKLWLVLFEILAHRPIFHDSKYRLAIAPEHLSILSLDTEYCSSTRDQSHPHFQKTKIYVGRLISVAVAWKCRNMSTQIIPDLPRLAEVPEFEWSVPMVLMPFVRLLRSQDFVPFVLLCLALALPRGCMWLQAALVGVLLLYLQSLDVSRFVYFALCKAHGLLSADNCISQPFTSFNTISKYLKYLNLRSHLGKPWETRHMMWLDVTWQL